MFLYIAIEWRWYIEVSVDEKTNDMKKELFFVETLILAYIHYI